MRCAPVAAALAALSLVISPPLLANLPGEPVASGKDANGKPLDGVPFHPYYTVHDIFALSMFLMAFTAVVFFAPEFGGYFLE